jgi:hypothetical protein
MRQSFGTIVLLGCVAWPALAGAAIHRCVGPDGGTIYTDRRCEDFNAIDRLPQAPPSAAASVPQVVQSDCARRTDTLLFDLRRAIESDDINGLAGLYHWPGVSGRGARGIMDRLERIASRPLASVELSFPDVTPVRDDPASFPDGTPLEDPLGVRIEQALPGEIVASFAEQLRLVRHAGCWWLSF